MEPIAANVLYEKVKGFVCNGNAYSENYLGVFRLARFYSHSLDAVSLARSALWVYASFSVGFNKNVRFAMTDPVYDIF